MLGHHPAKGVRSLGSVLVRHVLLLVLAALSSGLTLNSLEIQFNGAHSNGPPIARRRRRVPGFIKQAGWCHTPLHRASSSRRAALEAAASGGGGRLIVLAFSVGGEDGPSGSAEAPPPGSSGSAVFLVAGFSFRRRAARETRSGDQQQASRSVKRTGGSAPRRLLAAGQPVSAAIGAVARGANVLLWPRFRRGLAPTGGC